MAANKNFLNFATLTAVLSRCKGRGSEGPTLDLHVLLFFHSFWLTFTWAIFSPSQHSIENSKKILPFFEKISGDLVKYIILGSRKGSGKRTKLISQSNEDEKSQLELNHQSLLVFSFSKPLLTHPRLLHQKCQISALIRFIRIMQTRDSPELIWIMSFFSSSE